VKTADDDLVVSVEDAGEELLIRCAGELTPATTHRLLDAVEAGIARGAKRIGVDCSDVGAPGSAAIKALVEIHSRCAAAGASLRLVVAPTARRVLDVVGLPWLGVVSGYEGASLQDTLRRYVELHYRGPLNKGRSAEEQM
jgi:anti-anti-sigma factor